jgi:hypothetical protein
MKYKWMVIILITSLSRPLLFAQNPTISNNQAIWGLLLNKLYFTDKLYIENELHWRRAAWGAVPQQFLVRPSINYEFKDAITLSLGYTFFQNDPYGEFPDPIPTQEHNIWEQLQFKHSSGRFTFRHRYRLEQRFTTKVAHDSSDVYHPDGFKFSQRLRYRLTTIFTIKNFEKNKTKLYAVAFDEIFIGLDWNGLFNQNWFLVGLGYSFNQYGDIQIGYMNQILKRNTNLYESNHNLQIIFSYNIYIKPKSKTKTNE